MILIADECLNKNIISLLEAQSYEVISISETDLGIDDSEVLKKTKILEGILITEDSDFGKWIFSHHFKGVSVIFLRYGKIDFEVIVEFLFEAINHLQKVETTQFITINKNKIRFRSI